jgi:hypothetical protein
VELDAVLFRECDDAVAGTGGEDAHSGPGGQKILDLAGRYLATANDYSQPACDG